MTKQQLQEANDQLIADNCTKTCFINQMAAEIKHLRAIIAINLFEDWLMDDTEPVEPQPEPKQQVQIKGFARNANE